MVGNWADLAGYIRVVRTSAQTETHRSSSPEETAAIAAVVAKRLAPGDVVLLNGELGSGKTVFVRAAAKALGFDGRVTSPTFAIGNIYPAAGGEIAHLDLYRLDQIAIDDEAVLADFLTDERIGFVEWPHGELGTQANLKAIVSMAHGGGDERTIEIEWSAQQQ